MGIFEGKYFRDGMCFLIQEKIKMLHKLDFNFNRYDSTWAEMFEELIKLKKETGKLSITREKNARLAIWIGTQRKFFKQGILSSER